MGIAAANRSGREIAPHVETHDRLGLPEVEAPRGTRCERRLTRDRARFGPSQVRLA
ncbi:MAG: hypothetical protein OXH79_14060 [Boseongicola sp.]|nr:hypothetical protein [Boseongicola sp.]